MLIFFKEPEVFPRWQVIVWITVLRIMSQSTPVGPAGYIKLLMLPCPLKAWLSQQCQSSQPWASSRLCSVSCRLPVSCYLSIPFHPFSLPIGSYLRRTGRKRKAGFNIVLLPLTMGTSNNHRMTVAAAVLCTVLSALWAESSQ